METNESISQYETAHDSIKEAETSILLTVYLGLFLGMVPVIGLPIIIGEMAGKILFVGLLLSVAAFASFFVLGTLFGMPRPLRNGGKKFSLTNSLGEISDWLSKILAGLFVVNLKEVPNYLLSLADYITLSTNYKGQLVNIYSICILFYFAFLGLYNGYNYMRLVLSHKYNFSDEAIIQKQLEKAQDELNQKDKKLIQTLSDIHEKEQLTKALVKKINKLYLPDTLAQDAKERNSPQYAILTKMIDLAKLKLHKGLILDRDDPQKGQWNSRAVNQERELKAIVSEETKGLYKIQLEISSTNPQNNPLKKGAYVLFALHDSFGNPPFQLLKIEKEVVELHFYSYGSFTVGAFAEQSSIELELDLAELPGISSHFKTH